MLYLLKAFYIGENRSLCSTFIDFLFDIAKLITRFVLIILRFNHTYLFVGASTAVISEKLSLKKIQYALTQYTPYRPKLLERSVQAAVAVVIREKLNQIEALFILRSVREGDPWSGDMAFPGGHKEAIDLSLREAAQRETSEEIGLDLSQYGYFMGELDTIAVNPRHSKDMLVTPFVYCVSGVDIPLNKNHEVTDVFWGDLDQMIKGTSLTEKTFKRNGASQSFPGYALDGQVIWGLTFRVLEQFFSVIDLHDS